MMRLCLILLTMFFAQANGQFLNQINTPTEEGTYGYKNILSQTHLIYVSENAEADMLWSLNLTNKTKTSLLNIPNNRVLSPFIAVDNRIYFSMEVNDSRPMLWSTDGTQEGTTQVSDVAINGRITTSNGQLFGMNRQNQLIQLKNNEVIEHTINLPSNFSICAFDENNFIVQTQEQPGNDYQLKRYLNGVVTNVFDYSSTVLFQTSSFLFDDRCYFNVVNSFFDDLELPPTVITVAEQGEGEEFNSETGVPTLGLLFPHQNRLYAVAGNDGFYNGIYRLTEDLEGYDAQFILEDGNEFGFADSTNQLISAYTKPNDSFFITSLAYFDSDLNTIPSYPYSSDLLFTNSQASQSAVIAGFREENRTTVIQQLDSENTPSIIQIKNFDLVQVITNPYTDELFLALSPPLTQPKLYSINENPIINDLINGTWHDPEIPNQGLVVQKGRRNDGSEYVFTTLYTYDQEEPLWLAGVSDLKAEQQQLSITLYQYDGPQLFQYNTTPNQDVFGELTLELLNCDQLKLTISSEIYHNSLTFFRIDDTSYDHLCADISPLTLNQINTSLTNKMEHVHE